MVAADECSHGLAEGALELDSEVLRDYVNMSAPNVLFVLKRLLDAGLPERTLLLALGPGFTTSGLALARV